MRYCARYLSFMIALWCSRCPKITKAIAFAVILLLLAVPVVLNWSSFNEPSNISVDERTALNSSFSDCSVLPPALAFSAYIFSSKPASGVVSFLAIRKVRYAKMRSASIMCCNRSLMVHLPGA